MHEMTIAQNLIQILREEMGRHGARSLKSVHLDIGQMSAVVPEALSFCFEVATSGTDMEGVRLVMNVVPLKGYCPQCKKEFEIKGYTFICPSCGSTEIKTIGGRELSVVEIEVD